ncbi:MAG TPA: endo-1,3-alpha-glucanase family glycosylhydrolase, partial [Chloroflexota bacterium]|nr:endo-1,3-alpha-glucanase family glycosylhydrolase [Chloroflexota bacterium]
NGDRFGEFREAFRPAGGMPNGTIAAPSLGTTSCADWQSLYFALRRSAGVNATTSLSRSWLDERITLHPDGSADVVETQRVTFTAGSFSHLDWDLPTAAGESVTNVQLREGDLVYAFDPAGPASRSAHLIAEGNDPRLAWSFPTIESPAERTYTITYHLTGATHHSNADTIFERQVVSPRESGPVWRTTVEIELPASVPANAVRLDSTGAPTRHDIVDGHTAWFEGTDLSAVSTLTVKLSLPAGFGSSVPPASSPAPTASVPTTAGVAGTPSRTATPTLGPSATPTATGTPSSTPTVTDTVTPGPANASALTATALAASSPSSTPTATATLTPTSVLTPSATPSNTPVAKASPTPTSTGAGGLATTCGQAPVLAMYYDWYDAKSWNSTLSDQPVAPYVSADRATIERQVTQAQSVGIDGFEVNWWGPNNQTDTNLQTLLSVARAHNFKVTVDFDLNSPFVTNNDQLTADIKYLSRYYADPAWFHYQGKPFIVFYGVSRQPVAAWATIRQQADPNQQVFWMGEGVQFTYLSVFDGIHPYSIAFSASPGSVLASYARQTRAYPGKVWMATAMPGYNDVGVNGSKGYVRDRANGAYYQSSWNGAVATNPDIINITSFNEWTEGSMIEPSKSYGDLYLNLTKQFIGAYRAGQGC